MLRIRHVGCFQFATFSELRDWLLSPLSQAENGVASRVTEEVCWLRLDRWFLFDFSRRWFIHPLPKLKVRTPIIRGLLVPVWRLMNGKSFFGWQVALKHTTKKSYPFSRKKPVKPRLLLHPSYLHKLMPTGSCSGWPRFLFLKSNFTSSVCRCPSSNGHLCISAVRK